MEKTIAFYNENAGEFAKKTLNVDFADVQDRFLSALHEGDRILDFGCGSGRDTKYFLSQGFRVDATDGSAELCKLASELTGIHVKQMLFSELDAVGIYDGIWACSSILHLAKDELKNVFIKMIRAAKDNGYIYASFKYGDFEGYRNERYFTDFTEVSFQQFIKGISGIKMIEYWISADVRPGRSEEKWLNLILQKADTV